jgi:Cu/Zn superoxide dismutase
MTKENAPMTHGIHIHNYGDMSDSCESLGSHFNPDDTAHADKDAHIR